MPANPDMNGDDLYNMVTNIFDAMKAQIQSDIDAGKYDTLNISSLQLDRDSFVSSHTNLDCPRGMAPRLNTFSCG